MSSAYHLAAILDTYGQPSEIWVIASGGQDEYGYWPASEFLFYPEHGFALDYSSNGDSQGNYLRVCLSQDYPPLQLLLWDPQQPLTFTEAVEKIGMGHQVQYYLPLDEATDMSIEEFYQTFIDPENEDCLETPVDIWSGR